ncbi:PHP domain-containing protein [Cohnella abietis]|uniref:Phosphatase n=1 Tax=Cohnella abietis TaxID=2507935 RepID=A0A3T1DD98_9BACL|nr:PHP domain-containing protein [Cohnella abietis]BBI35925.1 phosphatase [Cohnella abietis]
MIDLHCHTKVSDNSFTIREVISMAKEEGVSHLAITDHDTTSGLLEAKLIGHELGVHIIPGIEISAYDYSRQTRAHILGLYVTPGHNALSELCEPMIKKRHEASYAMVERIIAAGYDISWELVESYAVGGTGVYKQHIMHALLTKGYTETIYGTLYKKLFSRGEDGAAEGIAYMKLDYVNVYDAIDAIRQAGGVPVLAHPKQFNNFAAVPAWKTAGLQGIEVLHPLHDEQAEKLSRQIAVNFGLLQTGGSDFHGFYGEREGCPLGSKSIGEEHLMRLQEKAT